MDSILEGVTNFWIEDNASQQMLSMEGSQILSAVSNTWALGEILGNTPRDAPYAVGAKRRAEDPQQSGTKKRRRTKEELAEDTEEVTPPDWIPQGWRAFRRARRSEDYEGFKDPLYIEPKTNRLFRSKPDVERHLGIKSTDKEDKKKEPVKKKARRGQSKRQKRGKVAVEYKFQTPIGSEAAVSSVSKVFGVLKISE